MARVPATAPSASPAVGRGRPLRLLWGAVVALALAYPIAYVAIALLRAGYPFELEWMEGGVVDVVRHLLAGQPLYGPPSLAFTSFTYPPLYFYLGTLVSRVVGVGFTPLRLLSFATSLGTLTLIYATVRHASTRRIPALLATCLFAASYRESGAWFDLARVDSLYVCAMAAGIWAVRREPALLGHLRILARGAHRLSARSR